MKLRFATFLFFTITLFTACGGKENPVTPSISVFGTSDGVLSVVSAGGAKMLSLTSSLAWTAYSDASWISVNPASGKSGSGMLVEVTVEENNGDARTGKLNFSIPGTLASSVVTVSQEAKTIIPQNTPAIILSQDFTKGAGSFIITNKDKGGFSKEIWNYDAKNPHYGVQASASDGGSTNYKAESWLVSPEIDLTNYTDANLYFEHAFAYVKYEKASAKSHFSVQVSEDDGDNWTSLEIPYLPADHSYFELASSDNISLNAYIGKKIKFAFVYKSTVDSAPTWEVLNVTVSYDRKEVVPVDIGDKYTSVPAWMELPQVNHPENYYIHTATLRFDRVRNYSFDFNPDCKVSDWVAYPLYDGFTKSRVPRYDRVVSTNEAWKTDPFVKTPNVHSGGSYKWSSHAPGLVLSRGHQIPSADRVGGAMVNMQTFYTSNVTPQESNFNGGIWGDLESAVRGWSSASNSTDTLYVVTGCIADDTCVKSSDHDGVMVSIPKAYYKAILRLSKGSYIGVGFYLDHIISESGNKISSGNYKDYAMSLKDLEAKTGMTFFVNLPAETATKVKAENPKNNTFWNLK